MDLKDYLKDFQFKVVSSDNSEGLLVGTIVSLYRTSGKPTFKIVSHPKNPNIPKSNLPKYLAKFSVGKEVKLSLDEISAPLIIDNMSTDVWTLKPTETTVKEPIFIIDIEAKNNRIYLSDMLSVMLGQYDGIVFALQSATQLMGSFVPYEAYSDAALQIHKDEETGVTYVEDELMYKFIELYSTSCKYSKIEDSIMESNIPRGKKYFFKIAQARFGNRNKMPNFDELTFFHVGYPTGVVNTKNVKKVFSELYNVYSDKLNEAEQTSEEANPVDVNIYKLIGQMLSDNR